MKTIQIVRRVSVIRKAGFFRQLISLLIFGYAVEVLVEKSSGAVVSTIMRVGATYTILGRGGVMIADVNYRHFFSLVVLVDKKGLDVARKK